jgi:hypothetical protein
MNDKEATERNLVFPSGKKRALVWRFAGIHDALDFWRRHFLEERQRGNALLIGNSSPVRAYTPKELEERAFNPWPKDEFYLEMLCIPDVSFEDLLALLDLNKYGCLAKAEKIDLVRDLAKDFLRAISEKEEIAFVEVGQHTLRIKFLRYLSPKEFGTYFELAHEFCREYFDVQVPKAMVKSDWRKDNTLALGPV